MGRDRGQSRRGNYRRRHRRDRDRVVAARQRLAHRRRIARLESGAGRQSRRVGRPMEAGQDSPTRHPDSRRARRRKSRRHQDERRQGKSREGDRTAAVDHRADHLAPVSVQGAERRRVARSRDGNRGANSPRAVPETARGGSRGHRRVPAEQNHWLADPNLSLSEERSAPAEGGAGRGTAPANAVGPYSIPKVRESCRRRASHLSLTLSSDKERVLKEEFPSSPHCGKTESSSRRSASWVYPTESITSLSAPRTSRSRSNTSRKSSGWSWSRSTGCMGSTTPSTAS